MVAAFWALVACGMPREPEPVFLPRARTFLTGSGLGAGVAAGLGSGWGSAMAVVATGAAGAAAGG